MKKNAKFWVAVALVLCLISSVGASIFQTDFGSVVYHDMTFVTESGHELDALLLVPENATAENPAPAIGMWKAVRKRSLRPSPPFWRAKTSKM